MSILIGTGGTTGVTTGRGLILATKRTEGGNRFRGYLAVHSYGRYIVYPWGALNRIVEDHEELTDVGMQAAKVIEMKISNLLHICLDKKSR